jgi:adenylate kinase family enzyme
MAFLGKPVMLRAMTRVAIIGNAGGGKSTLARALSTARNLPLYPVDRWQWRPGWEPVPEAEVAAAETSVLTGDRWIIDGFGPWPQIEARFERADAIVFVDLPFWRHLWWATKRQAKSVFAGRPDGPEGCPMLPVTVRLYRMMWWIHRELRPRLVAAVERQRDRKPIFHLRSPADIARFRAEFC